LGRFRSAAGMGMEVDETRQEEHALGVDLACAAGRAGTLVDGGEGVAQAAHFDDAVALNDHVDGAAGLGAGAVDDGDTADHEAVEGAVAFAGAAVGGGDDGSVDVAGLRTGCGGEEEAECDTQNHDALGWTTSAPWRSLSARSAESSRTPRRWDAGRRR